MHALVDVTSEDWTRLVSANLTAPFFMMQAAISHLIARNGNVVNVISAAAFIGQAYAATKAGLLSLTKSQAMEHMHSTIRINALAPGGMLTPMALGAQFPAHAIPPCCSVISRFTRPPSRTLSLTIGRASCRERVCPYVSISVV